jgi:hypothetical protein
LVAGSGSPPRSHEPMNETMTTSGLRELGCLLFTLAVLIVSSAAAWQAEKRRPRSRCRLYGLCVVWCVIACFPFAMAIGYFWAGWQYRYDYPAGLHRFRWDLLVGDAGLVLLIGFLVGNGIGFLAVKREVTGPDDQPIERPPAGAGPFWSERRATIPTSNAVQPHRDGLNRERGGVNRERRG